MGTVAVSRRRMSSSITLIVPLSRSHLPALSRLGVIHPAHFAPGLPLFASFSSPLAPSSLRLYGL